MSISQCLTRKRPLHNQAPHLTVAAAACNAGYVLLRSLLLLAQLGEGSQGDVGLRRPCSTLLLCHRLRRLLLLLLGRLCSRPTLCCLYVWRTAGRSSRLPSGGCPQLQAPAKGQLRVGRLFW